MTRVLALCSAADPTGSVKQFDLALPSLRERFDVMRHNLPAGIRGLLDEVKPDLIHTLGAAAFRAVQSLAVGAVGRRWLFPKWVAAGAAAVEPTLGFAPGLTATISQSEHERDWAARLTPAPMQFSVPVGVECTPHPPGAVTGTAPGGCGVHSILACGGFDAVAELKRIVWAFDVLKYPHPQLRLVMLGDGPQRADIARFARTLSSEDLRVQCVGHHADITPYLAGAVQVWSTHTRGGTKFLLEAMAAGVPVLAYRTPDTERLLKGGECGQLVASGQPVEMAREAHSLLSSPDRARRLVVAGETEAARYPVADLADALAGVYHTLTSSDPPRSE